MFLRVAIVRYATDLLLLGGRKLLQTERGIFRFIRPKKDYAENKSKKRKHCF